MTDPLDPRPLLERPAHWRYRHCCWQLRYRWEERVAMSELGVGPEEAPVNENGRVKSLSLGGRNLDDEKLVNIAAFIELGMIYLVRSSFSDASLSYLAAHPTLTWVWVGESAMTERGLRQLEKQRLGMFVMRAGEAAVPDGNGGWKKLSPRGLFFT